MKSKPPFTQSYVRIFLLYCSLLAIPASLWSQKVVTNAQGDKIVQFADGSWKYYELSDSAIADLPTSLVVPYQGKDVYNYRTFQRYTAAAVKYEAKMLEQVSANQEVFDNLNDQLTKAELSGDAALVATGKAELDRLEITLKQDRKALAESRKLIRKILKIGKKEKYHKLAKVYVPGLEEMEKTNFDPRVNELLGSNEEAELGVRVGTFKNHAVLESQSTRSSQQMSVGTSSNTWQTLEQTPGVVWSSRPNMVHEYTCEFAFDGSDPFTGQTKKELEEEVWLTFTDERLKAYFHDRSYLSCHAFISSIDGGFRYLTLTFEITSRTARQEYGYIPKGSLLNIKLMNGKTVSLFSQNENHGTTDSKNTVTTYKVKYPIDFQKEKLLLKSEIDKVRVIWSTGYEDYEVHNIDLIKNQLNCLNN